MKIIIIITAFLAASPMVFSDSIIYKISKQIYSDEDIARTINDVFKAEVYGRDPATNDQQLFETFKNKNISVLEDKLKETIFSKHIYEDKKNERCVLFDFRQRNMNISINYTFTVNKNVITHIGFGYKLSGLGQDKALLEALFSRGLLKLKQTDADNSNHPQANKSTGETVMPE